MTATKSKWPSTLAWRRITDEEPLSHHITVYWTAPDPTSWDGEGFGAYYFIQRGQAGWEGYSGHMVLRIDGYRSFSELEFDRDLVDGPFKTLAEAKNRVEKLVAQ